MAQPPGTLFLPTSTTLLTPAHSGNDSRVYFMIVLTSDYCWRSWTCRIAAPYKFHVDWLIDWLIKPENSVLNLDTPSSEQAWPALPVREIETVVQQLMTSTGNSSGHPPTLCQVILTKWRERIVTIDAVTSFHLRMCRFLMFCFSAVCFFINVSFGGSCKCSLSLSVQSTQLCFLVFLLYRICVDE